jgi:hypothetical protein
MGNKTDWRIVDFHPAESGWRVWFFHPDVPSKAEVQPMVGWLTEEIVEVDDNFSFRPLSDGELPDRRVVPAVFEQDMRDVGTPVEAANFGGVLAPGQRPPIAIYIEDE